VASAGPPAHHRWRRPEPTQSAFVPKQDAAAPGFEDRQALEFPEQPAHDHPSGPSSPAISSWVAIPLPHEAKVRVHGEVAVVTGRNTIKVTYMGKDISRAYRFTDVFVKCARRWQVLTTQRTAVAPQ
jgi:hypothetical protein